MENLIHPFLGRHVIARCSGAGVHAGVLSVVKGDGSSVILVDARRLWRWRAKDGVALSGVAVHGIIPEDSIIDTMVHEIHLNGVVELIPTTEQARKSIDEA